MLGFISARRVSMPHSRKKFVIDQFTASEFFFDGSELRDYQVFARASGDPTLQSKISEYMLENDIKAADSSLTDDEVLESLRSKYDSVNNILSRVQNRITELRNNTSVPDESD